MKNRRDRDMAEGDRGRHARDCSRLLWLLLGLGTAARLLLAMAAMPPYAGLDETYHVARLSFVLQEHRNPMMDEPSIAPYLAASIAGAANAMPSYPEASARWPDLVRSRPIVIDRRLGPGDLRPYLSINYQAQHPSFYYSLVAPLAHLVAPSSLAQLRLWRFVSVLLAWIAVMATGALLCKWFGTRGLLAAALIPSMPTWITLVVRAGNDAMACALIALALMIAASLPHRILAEAATWAAAMAAKLYAWPVTVVLPLFWWRQRASWRRILVVGALCATSAALTLFDLHRRTHNPLGTIAFDAVKRTAAETPIRYGEMVKVTVASFLWSSGQHNDALTKTGMLLFAVPLVVMLIIGIVRATDRRPLLTVAVAVAAFGLAQMINAHAFIVQARAAGLSVPQGGKEGWYWYALAPLFAALVAYAPLRLFALWLVAWDVVIADCQLFHDFAGTATAAHPSLLFRWGPLHLPFTAHLEGIGVGPLAGHLILLRLTHLAALGTLFVLWRRYTPVDSAQSLVTSNAAGRAGSQGSPSE